MVFLFLLVVVAVGMEVDERGWLDDVQIKTVFAFGRIEINEWMNKRR